MSQNQSIQFIKRRGTMPFLMGLLLISAASAAWIARTWGRASIEHEMRNGALNIAYAHASMISPQQWRLIVNGASEDEAAYQEAYHRLKSSFLQLQNITYVYTVRLQDGKALFVVDATPYGDGNNDKVEDHSFLHEVYEDCPPELLSCLQDKRARSSEIYTDKWGTFISAFVPVLDEQGQVLGACGVDLNAQDFINKQRHIDMAFIGAGIPFTLILIVVALLIVRQRRQDQHFAAEQAALLATLRESNAQLESARVQADESNQSKSRFLAMMSHELRTPLNAIVGFLELARSHKNEETVADHLKEAAAAADILRQQVDDVLDVSRIEAGQWTTQALPCHLLDIVKVPISIARVLTEGKGLKLMLDLPPSPPPPVLGDPLRLIQLFNNLLSNAVKYTDTGGVCLRLSTRELQAQALEVQVTVEDSGIGMDEATIKRIGEPFLQAHQGMARRYGGTGLGLTITRHFINAMGGSFKVSSVQGQGTTIEVSFTLPMAPASASKAACSAEGLSDLERKAIAGMRVLVVDDTPTNLKLAALQLSKLQLRVDTAEDGRTAVDKILSAAEPYDVCFMDLQMPEMDGYDAARAIRRHMSPHQLPIFALSANALTDDKERSLVAGMQGHLSKPVTRDELAAACAAALKIRQGTEEAPPS